jgi:hypothetical protein
MVSKLPASQGAACCILPAAWLHVSQGVQAPPHGLRVMLLAGIGSVGLRWHEAGACYSAALITVTVGSSACRVSLGAVCSQWSHARQQWCMMD